MDNFTLFDTFVHEKRLLSHNFNYLKRIVTHVTQCNYSTIVSLITLAFIFSLREFIALSNQM